MRKSKRDAIVDVSAKHFSKFGYSGASLEEIANEVGVTKPAIYYHFKDKLALYEAVLLKYLEPLATEIESAVKEEETTEKRLERYILTFGAFLKEHRCFAAILAHEFADNGENLPNSAVEALARTLSIVTSILNEGIEEGVFHVENPMVVQMMIVSPLIMHQTTQSMRQKVAQHVAGSFKILPEPDIGDLAKILSKKILVALKGGETI